MSETIGIFGGTFSPPHIGHIHAANTFLSTVHMDQLYIVPTFMPPHKNTEGLVTAENRLEMCKLAFEGPQFVVSDIELQRKGKSYTFETLEALAKENRTLYFLCGSDMALTLDQWYKPERIFELATIFCMIRVQDAAVQSQLDEKNQVYLKKFGKTITFLPYNPIEISSTEVRQELREGKKPTSLTKNVFDYIKEKHLYQ